MEQQRCLARTIGSEDRQPLPSIDVEVHPVEHRRAIWVCEPETPDRNEGRHDNTAAIAMIQAPAGSAMAASHAQAGCLGSTVGMVPVKPRASIA